MSFIERVKQRAKINKKTIVLPEYMDRRVVEAACKVRDEEIANIIIVGNKVNNVSAIFTSAFVGF